MTARTRVVIAAPVVTDPVPRGPRWPVTPFPYVGRHRMPSPWAASDAIPVRHLVQVERRGMSASLALALMLGTLTIALGVWLAFAIAYVVPGVSR